MQCVPQLLNLRLVRYEQQLRAEEKLNTEQIVVHACSGAWRCLTVAVCALQRMNGNSFGFLSPASPVRQFCWGLVHCWPFQSFMLLVIAVNCVILMLDSPSVNAVRATSPARVSSEAVPFTGARHSI